MLFMPTPFPWYLLLWISNAFLVLAFLPQILHVWLQSRWISQCLLIKVELAITLVQLGQRQVESINLSIMEFNTSSRSALGLVSGELFRCNANRDFHLKINNCWRWSGKKGQHFVLQQACKMLLDLQDLVWTTTFLMNCSPELKYMTHTCLSFNVYW